MDTFSPEKSCSENCQITLALSFIFYTFSSACYYAKVMKKYFTVVINVGGAAQVRSGFNP